MFFLTPFSRNKSNAFYAEVLQKGLPTQGRRGSHNYIEYQIISCLFSFSNDPLIIKKNRKENYRRTKQNDKPIIRPTCSLNWSTLKQKRTNVNFNVNYMSTKETNSAKSHTTAQLASILITHAIAHNIAVII